MERSAALRALSFGCHRECTIARFVAVDLAESEDAVFLRFSRCHKGPEFIKSAAACALKTVCNHPATGDSQDFHEQVELLREHILEPL